jgi:hypothetical protein
MSKDNNTPMAIRIVDGFPRRNRVDLNTKEELLIRSAIDAVERVGAHPLLTDVVVKLTDARESLADWIDNYSYSVPVGCGEVE